jgi:hypothetical protein
LPTGFQTKVLRNRLFAKGGGVMITPIFSRSAVENVRKLVEQLEELRKLRDSVRRAEVRAIARHRHVPNCRRKTGARPERAH